ncbi:DUF4372 domain-containing protein [Myroides odoratimimus]|uniref:DUF4372 domain-containing protein n=1 Tax=Myroides odoratimimus CIP 101113 TaxID=883154 RepID=A0AAV3F1N5_9FLAO|nr:MULTISPECIES: DUF4372 domain-containing protein [Myroides]EHO09773.1 hypothetical protein HMPREF9715_02326 [Myroides odoratimimus CIP 101113]MEC4053841.1 DUF4372 domain-containing protein [Myroides odoratimimus]
MLNITVFFQIIAKLDCLKFKKNIKEKQTDKHNKGFNSWTHLISMLFYLSIENHRLWRW